MFEKKFNIIMGLNNTGKTTLLRDLSDDFKNQLGYKVYWIESMGYISKDMKKISELSIDITNEKNNKYDIKSINILTEIADRGNIDYLFIDDYEKKIGRVMDYNYEIIGEYKTYNKDIIEVVEKKSNVSSITWTLNRMNGDIETFLQSSEADVFNKVRNGEYKVRRYGNCQKFKNNVL